MKPLLSDERLGPVLERSQRLSDYGKMVWKRGPMTGKEVRDFYEAARKQDQERIAELEATGDVLRDIVFLYMSHQSPTNMSKVYDAIQNWDNKKIAPPTT